LVSPDFFLAQVFCRTFIATYLLYRRAGVKHLEACTIIDLIEERLGKPEADACKAHLKACSVCVEEYHFWRQMNSTLRSERLENPSEELTQQCISIFPGAPAASGFIRVLGQIVFDSLIGPVAALATRGVEGGARQLVVHIDEVDIHLRIAGSGSKQRIQGQILPRGQGTAVNAACITLLALGRSTQSTKSDDLGLFDFRDVPRAPLVMSVKLLSSRLVGYLSIPE
jgi:hypothetical protein